MSDDVTIKDQKLISAYGDFLFSYDGTGVITIINGEGEKQINCRFEASQLTNGKIFLLCNDLPQGLSFFTYYGIQVIHFKGTTTEGHSIYGIQRNSDFEQIAYLPENCNNPLLCTSAAFRIDELTVVFSNEKSTEIRFGLTNFEIMIPKFSSDNFSETVLSLNLKGIDVKIKAHQDFPKIFLKTKTLKTVNVIAETIFNLSKNDDISQIKRIMDDLCILMSIARGRKVQWVYHTLYNSNFSPTSRTHFAFITKPYAPLNIIDRDPENIGEIKRFLEISYSNYPPTVINFNKWVVEEYLAAKQEGDYLEARALKIVVTMEMLKSLNEKMPELKTRYFKKFITKLCEILKVNISDREIQLFYESRNSLVHQGEFYCRTATDKKKKRTPPLLKPVDEYFFLINFIDKIFIKLLNYDGVYLDWSNPNITPFPQRKSVS
jgi:hypothetical protein